MKIVIQSLKVTSISNKIDGSEYDMKYEDIDYVSADFSNNSSSDDE